MGFGGPVWHASACARTLRDSLALARSALRGVGSPLLGEWEEAGGSGVVHVRRRLSEREQKEAALAVRDIRGTGEVAERVARLEADYPVVKQLIELQGGVH